MGSWIITCPLFKGSTIELLEAPLAKSLIRISEIYVATIFFKLKTR